MARSKFVPAMRKASQIIMWKSPPELMLNAPDRGIRSANNIREILGREGTRAFVQLFLAYNLDIHDWHFLLFMDEDFKRIIVTPASTRTMRAMAADAAKWQAQKKSAKGAA